MRVIRITLGIIDCFILSIGSLFLATILTSVGCLIFSWVDSVNNLCKFGFDSPGDGIAAFLGLPLIICAFIHGIQVAFSPATTSIKALILRLAYTWGGVGLLIIFLFIIRLTIN